MNISEWRQGLEPTPLPTHVLWQWRREWGPTAATIHRRDITTAQTLKWQWPCTKMNKSKCPQFWMEGSCFQEKLSWKVIIYVVCASPTSSKYHRSPAQVLHHTAPQEAQGFGSREEREDSYSAQTLPTCSCRQLPFFSTTTTCCLLQGMLKLYVFLLYSSFVFPSFICSFPLSSHLNCMTLREWSLFSDFLKKEFLSRGWRLWANTKDNRTSLPEKCILFLYLSRKGFIILRSRRATQPLNVQPHFPRPEPRGTNPTLQTQMPPYQQWAPHLSSHQLIPTAPQGLRPGQGKLASKVVKGTTHKTVDTMLGKKQGEED